MTEKKKRKLKTKMITMRVTEEQWGYLNDMAERIRVKTGFRITRASIILKLMEYGYPYLQKEFPKVNKDEIDWDKIAS